MQSKIWQWEMDLIWEPCQFTIQTVIMQSHFYILALPGFTEPIIYHGEFAVYKHTKLTLRPISDATLISESSRCRFLSSLYISINSSSSFDTTRLLSVRQQYFSKICTIKLYNITLVQQLFKKVTIIILFDSVIQKKATLYYNNNLC